ARRRRGVGGPGDRPYRPWRYFTYRTARCAVNRGVDFKPRSRWRDRPMHAAGAYLARFYRKAYEDNVTGLAGMVAYNLLLSVLPLALLALFMGGQVLSSHEFQHSVLMDLERIFPKAAEATLRNGLE